MKHRDVMMKSPQNVRVVVDACVICRKEGPCLSFGDNEGYSTETLCLACLEVATDLVREHIKECMT